jgi:hypothetical protein
MKYWKRFFRRLFCAHDYEIINEFTVMSKAEMIHGLGLKPNTHTSFKRKYITDLKCNHCRKHKRLTEYSTE